MACLSLGVIPRHKGSPVRLRIEATPDELANKSESLIKALADAIGPAAPDLAEALKKALPKSTAKLIQPALREMHEVTRKEYEKRLNWMLKDIGKVLDRSLAKADVETDSLSKSGIFIGPRGGKWADPQHTIPWKDTMAQEPTQEMAHSDFLKTVYALIKHNDGKWKSEKQARFLLNTFKHQSGREVSNWAKENHPGFDPKKQMAVVFMRPIEGYGTVTASKRRYSALIAIVDGGGIVATYKPKVKHATKTDRQERVLYDDVEPKWKRASGEKSEHQVDLKAEEEKAWQEKKKQLKENEPHIKAIEKVQDWEQDEILDSFMFQLRNGQKLSPKQLGLLRDKLPKGAVDIGDTQQWADTMSNVERVITDVIIPAYSKVMDELSPGNDWQEKMTEWWSGIISGKTPSDETNWQGSYLDNALSYIHPKASMYEHRMGEHAGYFGRLREQVNLAVKKGNKATKKSLKFVQYATVLWRHLEGLTPEVARERFLRSLQKADPDIEKEPGEEEEKLEPGDINPETGEEIPEEEEEEEDEEEEET
jgi:hypothetical protein